MQDIQTKMESELQAALAACEAEVLSVIEPLEHLTAAQVTRARAALTQREKLASEIDRLQKKAANVG